MLSRMFRYGSSVRVFEKLPYLKFSYGYCTETVSEKHNTENGEEIKLLKDENNRLSDIIKETDDKYKRALAECENVRRRMSRQIDDAKHFGILKFCKDLVEVADILSMAINTMKSDDLKSNESLKSMLDGLEMTESQLITVFRRHGVEKISPVEGDKFDPNVHEALFQLPIPNNQTQLGGTVATLSKVGYRINQITLRPATVGVYQ